MTLPPNTIVVIRKRNTRNGFEYWAVARQDGNPQHEFVREGPYKAREDAIAKVKELRSQIAKGD